MEVHMRVDHHEQQIVDSIKCEGLRKSHFHFTCHIL